MRNYYCRSCRKFEPRVLNEDAAMARKGCIAVSDGAGGGGVFAERWSRYLLKNLPSRPITSFNELDAWVDGIWEPFYNDCETDAKARGGLFLEKFYDEGSFATLAAAWKTGEREWQWMTYGDSVVFCYHKADDLLEYSPIRLADFDRPPYLISDKDPLKEEGFHHGSITTGDADVLFVATDTLAHFVLMMYELSHKDGYKGEIDEALAVRSKNSNYVLTAMNMQYVFSDTLCHLLDRKSSFRWKLMKLERASLLGHDDYSLAVCMMPLAGTPHEPKAFSGFI